MKQHAYLVTLIVPLLVWIGCDAQTPTGVSGGGDYHPDEHSFYIDDSAFGPQLVIVPDTVFVAVGDSAQASIVVGTPPFKFVAVEGKDVASCNIEDRTIHVKGLKSGRAWFCIFDSPSGKIPGARAFHVFVDSVSQSSKPLE